MSHLLSQIRRLNGVGHQAIAEPFGGGAGASLSLLYEGNAPEVHINDVDVAIFSFWWAVRNRNRQFLDMLDNTPVTIDEWQRQREIYRTRARMSRLRKGFAAFFLNRCNRSGIVGDGGPIGGIDQKGVWQLDARFNKTGLRARLERIKEYRDRINVSGLDGIEFIAHLDPSSTFYFIDPPYYHKGESLYLNALDGDYHAALASRLQSMPDGAWVLTYDDCPEIRELYGDWADVRPFSLRYSAAQRRIGDEVIITPKWMRLPATQQSRAIAW